MKYKELAKLDQKELEKKLSEVKRELMNDNAQRASGTPPKSPGMMKERRKTIARIHTALNSTKEIKEENKEVSEKQ